MTKSQQAVLALGATIAFGCLFAAAKIVAKNYNISLMKDFDAATNLHDPQFAGAFLIGIVGSLFVFSALRNSE